MSVSPCYGPYLPFTCSLKKSFRLKHLMARLFIVVHTYGFHRLFWEIVFIFFISQAIINSTITPNMTFTKTSHKFGQWADSRANTVYGLGFSTEHHLAKVGGILSLSFSFSLSLSFWSCYLSFSSLCLWRPCSPFLSFSSTPCVSELGNTYTLCPNEELYSHRCVGGFFCAVLSSLSLPRSLAPLHYDDALSGAGGRKPHQHFSSSSSLLIFYSLPLSSFSVSFAFTYAVFTL